MNNSNTTTFVNVKEAPVKWHFIDATDKVLGRMSTDIAKLLLGKNKAVNTINQLFADKIVVTNAEKVRVTGKKLTDKLYYRHSGYAAGFKTETLEMKLAKDASKVIMLSVKGMLPKNKLQKARLANLYIYNGPEHPHTAQETK